MTQAGPRTVNRSHPRGARGTKVSVQEIVKKVEKGRLDPKTRAWSIETLQRGELGGFGADKVHQAKALFDRLKKERIYIEDPVDGEFMQSSACTLDGCEGLMFLGGDCDDLVIAFLSAIESVGIEGALVAHSYEPARVHTHVLCAIRDPKQGKWIRCDPSANDPFGTVSKPTRETFYGIPGGKVLADKNGPIDTRKVGSAMKNMRQSGDFVGVGTPFGAVGQESDLETAEPALEGLSDAFKAYMRQEVGFAADKLDASWHECQFRHEQYFAACAMMNDLMGGGYDPIDPPDTPKDQPRWTDEYERYYQALADWVPVMLRYLREAEAGKRELFYDPNGEYGAKHGLGYTKETILILGQAGELFVGVDEATKALVVKQTKEDGSYGAVSGGPLIAGVIVGGVVVGLVASYFIVDRIADTVDNQVAAKAAAVEYKFAQDYAAKYGTDKLNETLKQLGENAEKKAKAKVDQEREGPFSKVTETANTALKALMVIGIGGAVVYGISVASDLFQQKRAASAKAKA